MNENWQLLEKPIKFEKFKSNVKFERNFFEDGFHKIEPNKSIIKCSIGNHSLTVYKNNKKEIYTSLSIFKLEENSDGNKKLSNICKIGDKIYLLYYSKYESLKESDNIFKYEYILKEKGEYYLSLGGKDSSGISGIYKTYLSFFIYCS